MKKQPFLHSFRYAVQGVRTALREERNLRFHVCAAFYVYVFSLFYEFTRAEYCLITIMVGGVMALELVNSSLERAVERPVPERYMTAGAVKDMAAGAVLGVQHRQRGVRCAFVLGHGCFSRGACGAFFSRWPALALVLAATLVVAFRFIFGKKGE